MIKLEICTYNMPSCLTAQANGADRVELCASMPEGGITPSYSLIEQVRNHLDIEIMVMIRPRGGDFLYDDWEFNQMKRDIEVCKQIGVTGVVFGILTKDGRIDMQRNKQLLDCAEGMQTCFHRAIDMTADYMQSAADVISLGFTRILTSGAKNKAIDGMTFIKNISVLADGRTEIMAGSGVNPDNIETIYNTAKPDAFHFSAKKIIAGGMLFKNPDVSMGSFDGLSEYDLAFSDGNEILRAKNVISRLQRQ